MNVVIFEDEKHNAERLTRLLHQHDSDMCIIKNIASIAEGSEWIRNNNDTVDLLFMDIQLSDGSCFEIPELASIKIPIIFTTAYDYFAIDAFKVNSIDYLLKPIDVVDLKRALDKLNLLRKKEVSVDMTRALEAIGKKQHTRFLGRTNNQLICVKATDIAYVQVADGITKAITFQNQRLPLDYTMEQMEQALDKNLFYRINRNTIVHIDSIKKISTYYNSRLALQLSPTIEKETVISRERVHTFKNWLEGNVA